MAHNITAEVDILRRKGDKELSRDKITTFFLQKAACVLMAILLAVTVSMNAMKALAAESIKVEGNPQEYGDWFETVPIDIFEEKVEPGTSGDHKFTVKNTSSYVLNYELAFYGDNATIPLQYRIKSGDQYIIGDEDTWVNATTLDDAVRDYGAISVGGSLDLVIEWCWPFESGNDERDTLVGIGAPETSYYISVFGIERDANRAPQILRSNYVEVIPPRLLPITVMLLCFTGKFIYNAKTRRKEGTAD